MNQKNILKCLLTAGLAGSSALSSLSAFAAEPIIEKNGKYCPPMYLKMSGVCVNPEGICHSRSQLHEAIQSFLQQGYLDKRYHCANQKNAAIADNGATHYTPRTAKEAQTTENSPLSCSELSSTITQYQTAGVPLMDTSSKKISTMGTSDAEQVIKRLLTEQSQRCL